jgi:hypothetical protein
MAVFLFSCPRRLHPLQKPPTPLQEWDTDPAVPIMNKRDWQLFLPRYLSKNALKKRMQNSQPAGLKTQPKVKI